MIATASQTSFLEVNPTLSYYKDIYMIWMNGEAKTNRKSTYNTDSDPIADQLSGSEPDTSVLERPLHDMDEWRSKTSKKPTYNWDSDPIADQLSGSEPEIPVVSKSLFAWRRK